MTATRPFYGRWDVCLRWFHVLGRATVVITVRESGRRVHHGAGLRRESGGVRGTSNCCRRWGHFCTSEAGAEGGPLSLSADPDLYHCRPQVRRTSILRRMVGGRDQERGGARCEQGRPEGTAPECRPLSLLPSRTGRPYRPHPVAPRRTRRSHLLRRASLFPDHPAARRRRNCRQQRRFDPSKDD